jgi:hypothetical protein
MVSERRLLANRMNAKKSTGPRTAAGKARSSANALRHGFAASPESGGACTPEVEALTAAICANDLNSPLREAAKRVAENQLLLARVRRQQAAVLNRIFDLDDKSVARSAPGVDSHLSADSEIHYIDPMDSAFTAFRRLARYERRARSQLKRAFYDLERARVS